MKLTNKFKLPDSFVKIANSLIRDQSLADKNRVGVTTLINPPRIKILTNRHWHKLEEDVSQHIWKILGIAGHWMLEQHGIKSNNENQFEIEKKLTVTVDGITIVGKLDSYDSINKKIEDWKFTSVWSFRFGEHKDWEAQLNCYAYILKKHGYDVNSLHVNAILKDWRKGETKKYADYPKVAMQSVEIPLWDENTQEEYIKNKVLEYKKCLGMSDEDLPICTPEERWAKEDVYAVHKNKNRTASRLLKTDKEAKEWAKKNIKKPHKARIEKRVGEDLRCLEYCSVNKLCSYYKERYGTKTS